MVEDETQRVVDLSGDVSFLKYPGFPLSLDGVLGSDFLYSLVVTFFIVAWWLRAIDLYGQFMTDTFLSVTDPF